MIIGIGIDTIEIERIEKAIEKASFVQKIFTPKEIMLYHKKGSRTETLAGNFAAKEAISKTLGCGFSSFPPSDIEILRKETNEPYVILHDTAKKIADNLGVAHIFVSISHDKTKAIAFAVAEK